MRISEPLAQSLARAIQEILLPAPGSELFLFGSRADPKKRGGDIDLCLVTDEASKLRARDAKLKLRAVLREVARDQRVDLSVITLKERENDPFFSSILDWVKLKAW